MKKAPPPPLLEEMEAHVTSIAAAHKDMSAKYQDFNLKEVSLELGRELCKQFTTVRIVVTIENRVEGDEHIRLEPIAPTLPRSNAEGEWVQGFGWSLERIRTVRLETQEGRYWPSPEALRAFIAGYKQGRKQVPSTTGLRDLQDVLDRTR